MELALSKEAVSKAAWTIVEEAAVLKAMKTNKERIAHVAPLAGKKLDAAIDFKEVTSGTGVFGVVLGTAMEASDEAIFTQAVEKLCEEVLMVSWPEG